ncbi:MAG: 16S rRNA (guanine(966)-N(2))-methyltransferase RsmD [Chloroflexota bacterium]|nr:16S rRNA (guanine(966)-N(2))-methyltransferase RsmD [Chloroflexota bacterium]
MKLIPGTAGKNIGNLYIMPSRASMRVAGGIARGRRIKGTLSAEARPTTERARAAIFNILLPDSFVARRALDLYAGSGSLGIEALSRGAGWVDFVERNSRQCGVIKDNLATVGFTENASVRCADVTKILKELSGPYSLIMLDPPYKLVSTGDVVQQIADTRDLVEMGGSVVVGHSRHLELSEAYGSLRRDSTRRYGDNVVEFYSMRSPKQ